MKNKNKKLLAITLLILILLLAGASIFISLRLKSKEQVAPNAPASKPAAATWKGGGSCNTSFTIEEPTGTGTATPTEEEKHGLTCTAFAYRDSAKNYPGTYYLDPEDILGPSTSTVVTPGQKFIYMIHYENNTDTAVPSATITDALGSKLSFIDSDQGCSYSSSGHVITCSIGEVLPKGGSQVAFRVQVKDDVVGSIDNSATVIDGNTCNAPSLTISTGTGTVAPTETAAPTEEPTGTGTATPTDGGSSSSSSSSSSSTSSGGGSSTSSSGSTSSGGVTSTPTGVPLAGGGQSETLPETGVFSLPGAVAFGGGLLMAVVGILLAL